MVKLKVIKFIKELLCSLSSYINLQSSDLCNPRPIGIMMIRAFGLIVDFLIEWGWSLSQLLLIWLSLVWSIPKAIHFTHKLHAWVIGVAIETCYCSYKFNFHRSDLSSRQFTLPMNCTLISIFHLGLNAVMIIRLSSYKSRFICHFRIATLSRKIVLW